MQESKLKTIYKEYFQNKYAWLKIYKCEEYVGDPNDIKWFW